MVLPIFPNSPMWADFRRAWNFNETVTHYEGGGRQGATPWAQPQAVYQLNILNMNEVKQSSLEQFYKDIKGMTQPWLVKDPYDYIANSITQPSSTNMTSGDGFFFVEANSYRVVPDSGNLYIEDPASGALTVGVDIAMSFDNGFATMLVPVSSLVVSSFEFFRKVAFESQLNLQSFVWNQFSVSGLIIQEIIPS